MISPACSMRAGRFQTLKRALGVSQRSQDTLTVQSTDSKYTLELLNVLKMRWRPAQLIQDPLTVLSDALWSPSKAEISRVTLA